VALVRAADGEILLKATGHDSEQYRRVRWNASEYLGEELYIEAVDEAEGGWGHLNLDDVNVPTEEQFEDVVVPTPTAIATALAAATVVPTAAPAATEKPTSEPSPTSVPAAVQEADAIPWLPVVVAAVVVVAIVIAVVFVWRRRKGA
jgi:hypothetical protein